MPKSARPWFFPAALLLTVALTLTACQQDARYLSLATGAELLIAKRVLPVAPVAPQAAQAETPVAAVAPTPVAMATPEAGSTTTITSTITPTASVTAVVAAPVSELTPEQQAIAEAAGVYSPDAPVVLAIPALAITATVTPMGWEPAMSGDQIVTRWIVPTESVGWAVNSAAAGEPGNTLLVGHQMLGAAPLRALALGLVQPGQDIYVTTARGTQVHYVIDVVSEPLPAIGATADESAQAAAFAAATTEPRLTLITGWPSDVSTHRIFVQARLATGQP